MSLQAKRELLYRMRSRYQQGDRAEKTQILDGFIAATGYHRKYAAAVLSRKETSQKTNQPKEPRRVYDAAVKQALVAVWNAAGQICSKRLCPFLPEFVETLERFGHLRLSVLRKLNLITRRSRNLRNSESFMTAIPPRSRMLGA